MENSRAVFHFRPMAVLALGVCVGIISADMLKGTWFFTAMCLFLCFFILSRHYRLNGLAVFCIGAALGLVRCMFHDLEIHPDIMAPFHHIRQRLIDTTSSLFGEQAPILQAMLWGYKDDISQEAYAAYRSSGIAHVLALSGLHVSFVSTLIDRLTRNVRPKPKFYFTAVLLVSYCAIAAFPASLIRASVMTLCALYGRVCGRRYDMLSGMSFSALIILAAAPSSLFDIGFQLSFGAVLTIALLMNTVSDRLNFLPDDIAATISVSVCGTLGTLPFSVYHFGTVPVLSLFANILILPLVPFVFVSALLISLAGTVLPRAAAFIAPIPEFLTAVMTNAAETVSAVDFAVKQASISPVACLFIYMGYICISDYPLISKQKKYAACAAMFAGALLSML